MSTTPEHILEAHGITKDIEPTQSALGLCYRKFSDVQSKPISWLWPGLIARGKVSIIAGDPGLGKSQLTAYMTAVTTTAGIFHGTNTFCPEGSTIFLNAEDDAADTIKPRLEAVGADTTRVYILDAVHDNKHFNLRSDLEHLEMLIEKISKEDGVVSLVIIDPITAYLGNINSHNNADVRSLMAPLGTLATKYNLAIVCITHMNKCKEGKAVSNVSGSIAFMAAARAGLMILRDPDDHERRFMLPLKNNLGSDKIGYIFTIEKHLLPYGIETSRVVWLPGTTTITADQILEATRGKKNLSALDEAKAYLEDILASGPAAVAYIQASAGEAGFSQATINRARQALGIKAHKAGMNGGWVWSLSAKDLIQPEEAQTGILSTFVEDGRLHNNAEQKEKDENPDLGKKTFTARNRRFPIVV